jgi:hypothetical protein
MSRETREEVVNAITCVIFVLLIMSLGIVIE